MSSSSTTTNLSHQHPGHYLRAMLLATGMASPAAAQPWNWNTDTGNWSTAANWLQLAPPPATADVSIGNLASATGAIVSLNVSSDIANLTISNGGSLSTLGQSLDVAGHTVLTGSSILPDGRTQRSEIRVGASPGLSFQTNRLTISNGARLFFLPGSAGSALVFDVARVEADSFISGSGTLSFSSGGTTLVNNGSIAASTGAGLRLHQLGTGRFDLDGTTGDGRLTLTEYDAATSSGSTLRLDGLGLSDSFSGRILIGPWSELNMNLVEGWVADASSEILCAVGGLATGPFANNRSVIRGGSLDFSGLLRTGFASGEARQLDVRSSQITLRPAANVEVNANSELTLGGVETSQILVEGGTFTVGDSAELRFVAPTEVRGGVFTTSGSDLTRGVVLFNGATEWRGNVTINGYAQQNGNATVAAPTVINATLFDMDGDDGTTSWNVNNSLVINANSIDAFLSRFDGTLNITAGLLASLTVNIDGPGNAWQMNGTANLAGSGALPVTRIAGSHMTVTGDLNVTSGIVQITADTTLSSSFIAANVNITENATLRMRGVTVVGANTIFSGEGTLQNGVNGDMVLESGAALQQVGLTNNSSLRIAANAPGIASVNRFVSTAAAVWIVDIGGLLPGAQHDAMVVAGGPAEISGSLDVRLIALGGGSVFAPNVGDEFTILFGLSGVNGSFVNVPVTQVGGLSYEWTVIYNPHTVVLRLENIVPSPAGITLLGLAGVVSNRRRRR